MIEIKINPTVIGKLREHGFYPDTMFTALFAMRAVAASDFLVLDLADDYSTSRRMVLVYYDLVRKGLFTQTDRDNKAHFELTDKGRDLLKELVALEADAKVKDTTPEWIQQWVELFPEGVKSGGKYVRSDPKSCLLRMRTFIKTYKYDRDTIFKATRAYIRQQEAKNWEFTRCAIYFIDKKGEGSDLATWCANVGKENARTTQQERVQAIIYNNTTGLV